MKIDNFLFSRLSVEAHTPGIVTTGTGQATFIHQIKKVGNGSVCFRKNPSPGPGRDSTLIIIDELKARFAKRAEAAVATRQITETVGGCGKLKPWQRELARDKEDHRLAAPAREAAEKAEDQRVAVALKAEKDAAAQKAAAAFVEKAANVAANLKYDSKGIPLPPPLMGVQQHSRSANPPVQPAAKSVPQKIAQNLNLTRPKMPDGIFDEILKKQAKITGAVKHYHTEGGELKPWQKSLIEEREKYARSAPERRGAEEKEDRRVAQMRKREAAEKAHAAALAIAEKAVPPAANVTRDRNGIPLPPAWKAD